MKQQKIKSGKINVNIIIIITNLKRKKKTNFARKE